MLAPHWRSLNEIMLELLRKLAGDDPRLLEKLQTLKRQQKRGRP